MKASGTIGATGILAALLRLTLTAVVEAHDTTGAATVLGSQNARFTINGEATFLLGISYYGALGASEDFIQQDLDDLQRHGFNWLRVWATWAAFENDVSAVNANGSPGEPFLAKLTWLVAECDRRGMIVDVTLTRGKRSVMALGAGNVPDFAPHQREVETIIGALQPHRNWYLDLANERDVGDVTLHGSLFGRNMKYVLVLNLFATHFFVGRPSISRVMYFEVIALLNISSKTPLGLDSFFSTTAQFARIFSTVVLSDFEIRTSDLRLRRARSLSDDRGFCERQGASRRCT